MPGEVMSVRESGRFWGRMAPFPLWSALRNELALQVPRYTGTLVHRYKRALRRPCRESSLVPEPLLAAPHACNGVAMNRGVARRRATDMLRQQRRRQNRTPSAGTLLSRKGRDALLEEMQRNLLLQR